ncbi:MAG: V-type ATP synthase subunit E [Haloferacaceae archaeon]
MSLETVVEDIREEAREEAAAIREEGEARAEEIISEAEADAERIHEEARREAEQQIEREREQAVSSAKLEAKQDRLEARRDALQEVRAAVEERVASMAGERREELTRALLANAAEEFEGADASVYCRPDDEALVSGLVDEFDGLAHAGETDCLGGVIVESEASRVRVDNTFDSVLDDVWEDSLKDVSDRLFPDG